MLRLFCVLGVALLVIPLSNAVAQAPLTVDELVTLINSNKERLQSLEIEFGITTKAYPGQALDALPEVRSEGSILLLWTPNHIYTHSTNRYQDVSSDQQYEWTNTWTKYLDQTPDGKGRPMGRFSRDPLANSIPPGYPFFDRLWTVTGVPLEHFRKYGADVVWDSEHKTYTMSQTFRGTTLSMTVDPSLGFMPRSRSQTIEGGKPYVSVEFLDYQEVEPGLWMPGKYIDHSYDYVRNELEVTTYTLKRTIVNKPIDEQRMCVTFPTGTHVIDEIRNERYTVAESETDSARRTPVTGSTE